MRETWVRPVGWEDLLKKGTATSVFWPGEFHGLYSAWGCKELDTTEQLALSVFEDQDPEYQSSPLTEKTERKKEILLQEDIWEEETKANRFSFLWFL